MTGPKQDATPSTEAMRAARTFEAHQRWDTTSLARALDAFAAERVAAEREVWAEKLADAVATAITREREECAKAAEAELAAVTKYGDEQRQRAKDAERERDDLRRLVGRLQTGNAIESDYVTRREDVLMAERDDWHHNVADDRSREIVRLDAHNALQQATLHELHARMKTKDAENDRLRATITDIIIERDTIHASLKQLDEDNNRLRAALGEIASDGNGKGMGGGLRRDGDDLRDIARRALDNKGEMK